ncbi:urease accessory protein UreF [Nitrosococcus oceani]|uniref:urease accessory protein UreF n=1 Tax=Nitrosococcus oceani TaxID=1229 RepID=UPI0004E973FE|nr:urease accessory protein UreF [Nitrosococcus oceani]KFI21528.1 urease accessory protein UreF [Nitrosococcus oceani]
MNSLWPLLRLASPQLPIGAYTYSQGLESAIDQGIVWDADSARLWLSDQLAMNIACFEAPLFARMLEAAAQGQWQQLFYWAEEYVASRETRELYQESRQMGFSLVQLLNDLPELDEAMRHQLLGFVEPPLPLVWAVAARTWNLDTRSAVAAWLWGWLENQLAALMKALPLGQQAAQRLLSQLLPELDEALETALACSDEQLANGTLGLSIASMIHETQYTRLFRS